jgi:hypothetical protein
MAKMLRKNIKSFFKNLLTKWLEDFFIFIGIGLILITTYQKFGDTIGNYLLGLILLLLGLLLAKK